MRWHSPRRLQIETDGALILIKDGLESSDWVVPMIGLLWAAMAGVFALIALSPHARPEDAGEARFFAAAIGCAVVATGIELLRRHRRSLGRLRIGPDAIEFVAARGPARRLPWPEVARVRWFPSSFKLEGPSGAIALNRRVLPEDAWDRLRAAVEAALSPRFDLAELPPPPEGPWWHFPLASLPPCVLIGGEALFIRDPAASPRAPAWSLFGMLALLAGYCILLFAWSRREWDRRTWHHPRPGQIEAS